MKKTKTDILILGSGIAGLSLAIKASSLGKVSVVTKAACSESNTRLAQGGIACVWDEQDNFLKHIEDTLTAGAGHCKREAVELMVKTAPQRIQELAELGVPFTSSGSKKFELGREGGHSHNRILHIDDQSGMAIENVLIEKARSITNIEFFEYHFAAGLLKDENNKCTGAVVLDTKNTEMHLFNSKVTVLATGGAGQVYEQTTNPLIATGDGYAMASLAGAKLKDMEFVQFHPTSLFHPQANGFLISEALRGFGAELVLPDGTMFMKKYHKLGSLAPRDIVSRSIFTEMKKHQIPCVYLDATSHKSEELLKKFPSIYKMCFQLGIDISEELIPVVPSAHYMCGGVLADLNGLTSIENLFAIGEVSCTGVHGANRLASNSLLEGLVFADQAFKYIRKNRTELFAVNASDPCIDYPYLDKQADKREIEYLKSDLRKMMWEKVGITRNTKELIVAKSIIEESENRIANWLSKNTLNEDLLSLRNMVITSKIIIESTLKRKESMGTHFIEEKKILYKNDQILA